MNKLRIIIPVLFCVLFTARLSAQGELNCAVTVEAPALPGTSDKQQMIDQLKKVVFEFMNNTKWTKDAYTPQEKITCSIFINIVSKVGTDEYQGTIQVQSERPVYKSSYNSPLFNYIDENFQFKYQQFTQLEYNMNTFQNNLTSVLMYYAFVIIAEDYDSFSPLGGTEYWQKAQQIVNNAQGAAEKGWKSFETNKNRYWLVENQLQPVFQGIRDCMYRYHREALDIMSEKPEEGRANLIKALEVLKPVYQNRPASYNMQLFFNAKGTELVQAFSGPNVSAEEKTKALDILLLVDPANTTRYLKIQDR